MSVPANETTPPGDCPRCSAGRFTWLPCTCLFFCRQVLNCGGVKDVTYDHGPGRWPAAGSVAEGWFAWAGFEPRENDPARHRHAAPDGREFVHRHKRGSEPHDHSPAPEGGRPS